MLARAKRLARTDFKGKPVVKRLSSAHFGAVLLGSGRGYAVVLPKKAIKRAVDRHRLKRRTLGALERVPHPWPAALILFPKPSALAASAAELEADLAKLLSQTTASSTMHTR